MLREREFVQEQAQFIQESPMRVEIPIWYESPYWKEKTPLHEMSIELTDSVIHVYNFNPNVSERELNRVSSAVTKCVSAFPEAADGTDFILLDNIQQPSPYNDDKHLPRRGEYSKKHRVSTITPLGASEGVYRVPPVQNLEAVVTHEMAHGMPELLLWKWAGQIDRKLCNSTDWGVVETSTGRRIWRKIDTNIISLDGRCPANPEECVSEYAQTSLEEDICESIVAYLYNPELLQEVSPRKFNMLNGLDEQLPVDVKVSITTGNNIRLPGEGYN